MNLCHGGGEERDEFESVTHFVLAGEGGESVPLCLLLFQVLGGGEKDRAMVGTRAPVEGTRVGTRHSRFTTKSERADPTGALALAQWWQKVDALNWSMVGLR